MAKINNIPTLTAYQQKFLAWQLDRRRSSSDEDKFTSVLAEAQVDLNPHQVDAALFGHTHRVFYATHNGVTYLNPGSIGSPPYGVPPSYAVLEIDGGTEEIAYDVMYLE